MVDTLVLGTSASQRASSSLASGTKVWIMEIENESWNMLISIMDFESDTSNFKISFKDITKKYGRAYIVFCKAQWEANEGVMTEDEFMKMNGDMPRGFFEKNIK